MHAKLRRECGETETRSRRRRSRSRTSSRQVGRRYRRQEEIGAPFELTVDGQSVEDETVTIRDRDFAQERIPSSGARDLILDHLAQEW